MKLLCHADVEGMVQRASTWNSNDFHTGWLLTKTPKALCDVTQLKSLIVYWLSKKINMIMLHIQELLKGLMGVQELED